MYSSKILRSKFAGNSTSINQVLKLKDDGFNEPDGFKLRLSYSHTRLLFWAINSRERQRVMSEQLDIEN